MGNPGREAGETQGWRLGRPRAGAAGATYYYLCEVEAHLDQLLVVLHKLFWPRDLEATLPTERSLFDGRRLHFPAFVHVERDQEHRLGQPHLALRRPNVLEHAVFRWLGDEEEVAEANLVVLLDQIRF